MNPPRLARTFTLLAVVSLAATPAAPAFAVPNTCGRASCYADGGGLNTSTSRRTIENRPTRPGDDGSPVPVGYTGPLYEYTTTSACPGALPGTDTADALCTNAVIACTDPARGNGPLTRIWRRTVQGGKVLVGWTLLGVTCFANVIPGGGPRVTMAMILRAFHTTPWSKPVITTQPVGNTTLVGLPSFFAVTWAKAGFQPGEVDTLTLLGFQVQIRPRLDHFTYVFGDGDTFGPTTETGGVYPTGTITHPYLRAGTYATHVDTTFAADFRVNGGTWAPVPDTATVPGPTTTLTVRTATNHLVSN